MELLAGADVRSREAEKRRGVRRKLEMATYGEGQCRGLLPEAKCLAATGDRLALQILHPSL